MVVIKGRCIEILCKVRLKDFALTQTDINQLYQNGHFEEGNMKRMDFIYVDNTVVPNSDNYPQTAKGHYLED